MQNTFRFKFPRDTRSIHLTERFTIPVLLTQLKSDSQAASVTSHGNMSGCCRVCFHLCPSAAFAWTAGSNAFGRPVIVLPPFPGYRSCLSFRQFLPPFLGNPPPYFPPSTPPPSPPLLSSSLSLLASASHCGLVPPLLHLSVNTCSHHYTFSLSRPGLSLWQVPPCVSPFLPVPPPISAPLSLITLLTSIPLPPHHIWPGLSLWQVPAYPPHFPTHYHSFFSLLILFLSPSPTYIPQGLHSGPACHCGRSRHIILSRFISQTSFLALPPYQSQPTSLLHLPLQAPGPACHCGWSSPFPLT